MLHDYLLALGLTVFLELLVVVAFRFRSGLALLSVVLINCITNPLLNYFWITNGTWGFIPRTNINIIISESIVVVLELLLLIFALGKNNRFLPLTLLMNAFSFAVGLMIF